jgi:hypothetical protein
MLIVLFIVGIAGTSIQVHPASAAEASATIELIEVIEDLEPDADAILAAGAPRARRGLCSIAPPRIPRPSHAPAARPPVPPPER